MAESHACSMLINIDYLTPCSHATKLKDECIISVIEASSDTVITALGRVRKVSLFDILDHSLMQIIYTHSVSDELELLDNVYVEDMDIKKET